MILYLTSFLSLVLFGYYLWYLTWPKARGVVDRVETGVSNVSQIRSPRKYRMLYYQYERNSVNFKGNRQGLFVATTWGPRKLVGSPLTISVCDRFPNLSCPYRPFYELLIVVLQIFLLLSVGLLSIIW